MQILGKKSKVLLMVISITMLIAIGISFATWDTSAVNAASGDLSTYANAKVGETVFFGNYYQTNTKDAQGEYVKTPIEWLVVDKDERTSQLTLMSKYILAVGSYFGNYYYDKNGTAISNWGAHYDSDTGVGGIPYNQAYVDSTVRAYLNNLERLDMGGDEFISGTGYLPSNKDATTDTGLFSSIGFSNHRYWTGLSYATVADKALVDAGNKGFFKRADNDEIYYQRPIEQSEYLNRPATLGFYDEAFTNEEKAMIVPKQIAGYIGHRWPDNALDIATKSYVESAVDKVWLPSATELNIMSGQDWNSDENDAWTNPSDETGSTVFEYFKDYEKYGFSSVVAAIKTTRTPFAKNSFAMNYSIPVYKYQTTEVNLEIDKVKNSVDHYWTRSSSSYWFGHARVVNSLGLFSNHITHNSYVGVRPCVILKY